MNQLRNLSRNEYQPFRVQSMPKSTVAFAPVAMAGATVQYSGQSAGRHCSQPTEEILSLPTSEQFQGPLYDDVSQHEESDAYGPVQSSPPLRGVVSGDEDGPQREQAEK